MTEPQESSTHSNSKLLAPYRPTLLGAITGLIAEPVEMTRVLFSGARAPHVVGILLLLVGVIFTPIFIELLRWNFLATQMDGVMALILTLVLTIIIFVLIERILTKLWGEELSYAELLALIAYGSAPLILIVLIFYGVNLAMFGRLSIVTFVITGAENANDPTMQLFPWAQLIGKLAFLNIFFHGIRAIKNLRLPTAFLITLTAAVPFYVGFFIALILVEMVLPGSTMALSKLSLSMVELMGR